MFFVPSWETPLRKKKPSTSPLSQLLKTWKQEKTEAAIQFSKEDAAKGTYCLITLYKAVPGTANSKENFDLAWASLVKEMVTVSTPPEMQPSATENGWETQTGLAPFESDGNKGVVLLVTASAVDKMANLIIVTNTDVYEKEIAAFLESVSLKKPVTALQQNNKETNTQPASSLTNYAWKSHQNRKDALGNNAGYSTNSYQFYSNGTYKFSNTTFQYYTPKYYMVNEEGTYQVNGNKIILKPVKSKFEVRQREKTDPVSKSGNLGLAVVEYSFEYTTVYDRQRLVLVPANEKETKRDGIFNYYVNGEKTKSYLYDAEEALLIQTTNKPNESFQPGIGAKQPGSNTDTDANKSGLNNISVIGSWGKSNSVSQLNNRYGTYSYNKQQYIFNRNGLYTFSGKNYSEDYAETILIKETGSYIINGNKLTIVPETCVIESWSKKNGADNWGQLKSSQKKALEKATYQVTMEGKNLILSISKETTRDGRFSNGNYYSYGPPETFTAIKLPGQ